MLILGESYAKFKIVGCLVLVAAYGHGPIDGSYVHNHSQRYRYNELSVCCHVAADRILIYVHFRSPQQWVGSRVIEDDPGV